MKSFIQRHGYWIWMAIILILTSIPGDKLPEVQIDFGDKLIHAMVYYILGYLILIRFGTPGGSFHSYGKYILAGFLFGALDELHQKLIPGRYASMWDLLADWTGLILAMLIYIWFRKISEKKAHYPEE